MEYVSVCAVVQSLTLKKLLPWLASSASDLGLFLLYRAYIPNWSCCKCTKKNNVVSGRVVHNV